MNKKREWAMIQRMMVGDFNENHDPETGQFTSGSGGGSGASIEKKTINGYEYSVAKEMPEGWKVTEGAMTAPKGYKWIDNNKSRFGGERKSALIEESKIRGNRGTEIKGFNEALQKADIHHAIEKTKKDKVKAGKKAYIDDLVKQGVDKETAKTIANVFFEYGIVKPL